jgi:hypothetical protein
MSNMSELSPNGGAFTGQWSSMGPASDRAQGDQGHAWLAGRVFRCAWCHRAAPAAGGLPYYTYAYTADEGRWVGVPARPAAWSGSDGICPAHLAAVRASAHPGCRLTGARVRRRRPGRVWAAAQDGERRMTHEAATEADAARAWLSETWRHGEVVADDEEGLVVALARGAAAHPPARPWIALLALLLALAVLASVTALLT